MRGPRGSVVEAGRRQAMRVVWFLVLAGLLYFIYRRPAVAIPGPAARLLTATHALPSYALMSMARMLAAYLLALGFSLLYGYVAWASPAVGRFLMPLLDVLQSVPVLGFFPAAVFFFVGFFHGGRLGLELAAVFLIFTSQAWNITFGVYEALTTIPQDLQEAARAFGLGPGLRFSRLLFPAMVPKLVYNSMLSWAGGWYFLIACEIIALGPINYTLPGLGSYLINTAQAGRLDLTMIGLAVLVALIILLDLLLWRPLGVWAARFKYEYLAGGSAPTSRLLTMWRKWPVARLTTVAGSAVWSLTRRVYRAIVGPPGKAAARARRAAEARWPGLAERFIGLAGRAVGWAVTTGILYLVARSVVSLARLMLQPLPPEARLIPAGLGASFLRLAAAYLISLAWTLPAAYYVASSDRAYGFLMPVFEVLASVPATALFPVIVFVIARRAGGMNLAAVLLALTGMQWYLLFNLISGVRSLPADLKEAAQAYGLKGRLYLIRVVLPAVFPSLVTGSITAWGGGWNALIIAEYVVYGGQTFTAFGIGSLLDQATYQSGNLQQIWLALMSMVLLIVATNRLFWRPLYNLAARRFKIDY
ncbi:MAG TPA: ABC transporter permease subunit [Bacillota bacterium]